MLTLMSKNSFTMPVHISCYGSSFKTLQALILRTHRPTLPPSPAHVPLQRGLEKRLGKASQLVHPYRDWVPSEWIIASQVQALIYQEEHSLETEKNNPGSNQTLWIPGPVPRGPSGAPSTGPTPRSAPWIGGPLIKENSTRAAKTHRRKHTRKMWI